MKLRYCPNCLKAHVACFCNQIVRYNNDLEIIILQHPTETSHPLGTAQIAKLSFENLTIYKGEDFSTHEELNSILLLRDCYLLFPGKTSIQLDKVTLSVKNTTIIVLDGTWKKAKKIYYSSKNLQSLKQITLDNNLTSEYILRKEPKVGYLSTLESIVHTLEYFENRKFSRPIDVLKNIQSFQIEKMGKKKFKEFYNDD
jgi:DTW domain-containing protein YfiP